MKSSLITLIFTSLISFSLCAQVTEPVIVKWDGITKVYLQNGKYLNHDQLVAVLNSRPESESECIISEKQGRVFGVLALPAVVIIAVDRVVNWVFLPTALGNSENNRKSEGFRKTETIIGLSALGLAALGVPFILSSNAHLKKSISNYNNSSTTRSENISINFGIMGNGVGIQVRF